MPQNTLTADQALKLARSHEKKGEAQSATELYQLVLASFPQHKQAKKRLKALQKSAAKKIKQISPSEDKINHLIQLYSSGLLAEAIDQTKFLLNEYPEQSILHNLLGVCFYSLGQFDDAIKSYERALEINPQFVDVYNNLGIAYSRLGNLDTAIAIYKQALEINPDYFEVLNNLGVTYKNQGEVGKAIPCFNHALQIKPDYAEACNNLGNALQVFGCLDDSGDAYRKALEIKPDYEDAFGNLLFTLNYAPDKSAEEIYSAYQEYDARFCRSFVEQWCPHSNTREPDRRIKIAYISPDLSHHSMRHFLEPLLANHDHSLFEIVAYAEIVQDDEVTERYKTYVDSWVKTNGLNDEELAVLIRKNSIDILIDLAGHTKNNRLGVMARKPAPVSISTMGYGYTSGLSAIDYFLLDKVAIPSGCEHLFSESLWQLQSPGFSYRPAEGMGEVSKLPALESGSVTFGTLTRAIRINHRTIRVWSEILKQVEGSRLIINSRDFNSPEARENLVGKFISQGVESASLEIGFESPPWDVMRRIDIGLDCFPHNSGTTLYEHLFMGNPFITLAGRPSVGRIGAAVLEGIGHSEWIASSEDEYIEKAVSLAGDLNVLSGIRLGLREQMQNSDIMDEPALSRKMEAAYRQMWQRWCEGDLPD